LPHEDVSLIFHRHSISVWIMSTNVGNSRNACHMSGMISEHWEVMTR